MHPISHDTFCAWHQGSIRWFIELICYNSGWQPLSICPPSISPNTLALQMPDCMFHHEKQQGHHLERWGIPSKRPKSELQGPRGTLDFFQNDCFYWAIQKPLHLEINGQCGIRWGMQRGMPPWNINEYKPKTSPRPTNIPDSPMRLLASAPNQFIAPIHVPYTPE